MPAKRLSHFILSVVFTVLPVTGWAAEEATEAPAIAPGYVSLGDALVLNLSSATRKLSFLQIKADVLVTDDATKTVVESHIPAIRHELIMLLSEQSVTDMKTPAKRELIRQQVTQNVRERLATLADVSDVEEVLFSTFLVQ